MVCRGTGEEEWIRRLGPFDSRDLPPSSSTEPQLDDGVRINAEPVASGELPSGSGASSSGGGGFCGTIDPTSRSSRIDS